MGKETDLWDDSALINAFDQAVNKYKAIHEGKIDDTTTGGEISTNNKSEPSSTDHIQLRHSEPDVTKNSPSEAEAVLTVDSSAILESQISESEPHISESRNLKFPEPTSGEDYSQLLAQYYELEEKRQSVIQRLQQAGYWNEGLAPQTHENYRQAPVFPSCCISPYESGISAFCPPFQGENREKGKEEVIPGKMVEEEDDCAKTDLAAVVNAWYSAGFYTGRYLLEHSLKRRSQ